MSKSKIEFKIVKDKEGNDIDLSNMSLGITRTLLRLLTSLTNIIDLADNNHEVNIKILKGSATLVAEGPDTIIQNVESDFNEIIDHKATNKVLVGYWGDVQNIFQANGLELDANIYKDQVKIPLFEKIKSSNKFRPKIKRPRKSSDVSLSFISGKLIEVGGKKPNIHVVSNAVETYTIGCNENDAIKVNKFLYKQVYLAVWRKKKAGENPTYTFCDSYIDKNIFDDFKQFFEGNRKNLDVDALVNLHNKLKTFLDNKDFGNLRKFLRLYYHESLDASTLKTILVITKSFREEEKISSLRQSIKELLESKIGILV